jgi:type I restriction-modification system DNA methylase subunit/restriction endonuclease S subunit
MSRSTVHYTDSETNNILKRLHNKLRPAGTPVERVEYIIELLLLRIFEAKLKQESAFKPLRSLFEGENYRLLFSHLLSLNGEQILSELNQNIFPFYASILSKSRKVITGNLPQKMQDQLVLMEEVFANSNFTNNVKGGVIAEVIGLVNEIEEKYILKTDLLGDAIESALSETGGTKDLGLYRTPDHIRDMMVKMVDPDFEDTIFDPACGTAGFLFDAYDYVIEKAQKTRNFPAENIANMFYRTGISGIEYQGRIRKMAAVNMYIRGLNPHNIDQGDSLKMFDPARDGNSKSVVIANPPFGAERDQPAYPNVWEEYSKESETTILFVKLMFDLLKEKGRCAVVVSESFLTWRQNSARALRKILLNDANLKAVISLPQGVFVSKSGQGAKTSILYFEKGEPTDFVWYYKIENDGFSMGTNRKLIEGNQIPKLLEIFAEIKLGNRPKETKHSFCVSKEQIETLDPRIEERIAKEVTAKITEKNKKKREKLLEGLDKKLANKKIKREMYDEKLWQFDNLVESQVENEITKAIEKAHNYYFNLQNYRSSLSDEQKKDWQDVLRDVEIKNGSKIGKRYKTLTETSNPKTALQILASFNPNDALQMDIAREYLNKLDKQFLEKEERLAKLFELLRETKQFPFETLGELLIQKANKIKLEDDVLYKQITIKLYGKGVLVRQEVIGSEIKTAAQFVVNVGDFIMSKIDARNGAFGIVPAILDGAVVTSSFPYFEIKTDKVNPKYLEAVVTQKSFYDQINNMVSGATGRRSVEVDNFLELQIPLPPLEVQEKIVAEIEQYQKVIDGVKQVVENWKPSFRIDPSWEMVELGAVCDTTSGGTPLKSKNEYYENGTIPWLRSGEIAQGEVYKSELFITEQGLKNSSAKLFPKNTVLVAMYGATAGQVGLLKFESTTNQAICGILPNDKFMPEFLYQILKSQKDIMIRLAGGGAQPNISQTIIKTLKIPIPPLEVQEQIVAEIESEQKIVNANKELMEKMEKKVEAKIGEVWGDEK